MYYSDYYLHFVKSLYSRLMIIALTVLAICFLVVLSNRSKNNIPPKNTNQRDDIDELITVILPTIDS